MNYNNYIQMNYSNYIKMFIYVSSIKPLTLTSEIIGNSSKFYGSEIKVLVCQL